MQFAGDQDAAREVLASLRALGPVSVFNVPEDDPVASALRQLGGRSRSSPARDAPPARTFNRVLIASQCVYVRGRIDCLKRKKFDGSCFFLIETSRG